MKKFAVICLFLAALSCQKAQETSVEVNRNIALEPTQIKIVAQKNDSVSLVELTKLANKPPDEFNKIFGEAAEIKLIESSGEYRLYKTAKYPKGLAVRFFGGKAKTFNLILEDARATSKEAIRYNFGIDVGNIAPTKDKNEPLSEVFKGTFGGVKFSKISAKRRENTAGFIFVLAEVAN